MNATSAKNIWAKIGSSVTPTGVAASFATAVLGGSTMLGKLIFLMCTPLLVPGLILAFVMPMIPLTMWLAGVARWFILVIEAVIAVPLWMLAHMTYQCEGFHGRGIYGYSLMFNVLFRPVLMLFGLMLGYARRRGVESEIVIPPSTARDRPKRERAEDAMPVQEVASGRSGFRERYEAHKRQQAFEAACDEQARELVRDWGRLRAAYDKALPGLEADPTPGRARRAYPYSVQALRDRGPEFRVQKDSNLARMLADKRPERAITILLDDVEKTMRRDLKLAAERAVAQELERSLSRSRDRGMTLG